MNSSLGPLRYPAVPLIVHDPYFSVWSFTDRLTESYTRHWTGSGNGMRGMVNIDGHAYRFAGDIKHVPPMEQKSVEVLPTRTVYIFEAAGIRLTLTFLTPALPHRLDIMSRPLTYLIFETVATDGREHQVSLYYSCGGDWGVDNAGQNIVWGRARIDGLEILRVSAADQRLLNRSGDNLRIEWGNLYLAVPPEFSAQTALNLNEISCRSFISTGRLAENDCLDMPRPASAGWLCPAASFDLGKVGTTASSRYLMIAFDDIYGIEYLGSRLQSYWKRDGMTFAGLLNAARDEFADLRRQCEEYDAMLMDDCRRIGGERYARLCALSFRQAITAHKLAADRDGTPLFFSKENFSNGCIATVDVTYPSAPLFLLTQPELVKGMLIPILDYAESRRWKFPFAPHDLGTYPLANGQVYGGGEQTEDDQMPVEECGNMLLLAAALAEFTHDLPFIQRYWPTLTRWAEYLRSKGYDPDNQLCTDDFAGHLAHNTNLSLKAILALGAYGSMAAKLGENHVAADYHDLAAGFAARWIRDADAGDHFRLAFDQPESWSQKYNLVWDRLLHLNLFPAKVAATEMAWYKKIQTANGLPLDNRKTYTKLDWIIWSATLTGNRDDFDALLAPVYDWINATPTRVPLTDWYETTDGKQVGFQARSVVGGVFIRFLDDPAVMRKYLDLCKQNK